ncbi:K+ transport systems, NAD-binding component [Candidatus Endolissoclinum faulkneri L5]|uniref:Trk system potassium uptake protein TrkA n=1 Tax=Candidatus Endolissoclinum faulkneri L5 TaxID=1401328 RepID=V9TUU7_9PROT|nr:Trk system potassium transporter TrkA [Candidatus Endolissoclinum faulkneri]AHC73937.1 K+ transport systems, NAD-binding component [Candidatus Endolissoclinum faulkneri L5]
MKIVICGAGQVGTNIAKHLASENNDVVMLDQSAERIQKISDTLDVQGITGLAAYPSALEAAGLREANMLIAVTYSDEVNMIACQIAHSIFNVPTKIARVRNQDYLLPTWGNLFSHEHIPIDVIISPEREIARAIGRRLELPGTLEALTMANGKIKILGIRCNKTTPIIHTPLHHLTSMFAKLLIVIIGIIRDNKTVLPKIDEQLLPGDEVYFVCDSKQLSDVLASFGNKEPEPRNIIVAGGGNIGLTIAEEIDHKHSATSTKVIECNNYRAGYIAQSLKNATVINGNVLDPEIMEEANISQGETFVAVSNEDEVNILSSVLAKRFGCKRTISLTNSSTYTPLAAQIGIDTLVNPSAITVSRILQHVRQGHIHQIYSIREDFGEVIEAEITETSILVGHSLKNNPLPSGITISAIVRGEKVILATSDAIICSHDRVIAFTDYRAVKKIKKFFSVGHNFF